MDSYIPFQSLLELGKVQSAPPGCKQLFHCHGYIMDNVPELHAEVPQAELPAEKHQNLFYYSVVFLQKQEKT